jgi:hypothetical protein
MHQALNHLRGKDICRKDPPGLCREIGFRVLSGTDVRPRRQQKAICLQLDRSLTRAPGNARIREEPQDEILTEILAPVL